MEICDLDLAESTVADEVLIVQQAGYAVEAELIGFKRLPPLLESVADVSRLDVVMIGARDGGRLIGVVGYRRRGDVVDIDRLVVHPTYFRRGVARTLLTEMHRRETTARHFEVSTGAANTPAIRLYVNLGYRLDRTESLPAGLDIVRLSKRRRVP